MQQFKQYFTVVFLLTISLVSYGQTTTYTVTSTANAGSGTLREKIDLAASGDIIKFHPSLSASSGLEISLNSWILISKDLSIIGPPDGVWINGNNTSRIFLVFCPPNGTGVKLENLYFKNGRDIYGGAIGITNCVVSIKNCLFKDNQANSGGAIDIKDNSTVTISNTTFISNQGVLGGAIKADQSTLTTLDCLFKYNFTIGTSVSRGGALFLGYSEYESFNCEFTENTIRGNLTSAPTIFNSTCGGAIAAYSCPKLDITDNKFSGNGHTLLLGQGGALYMEYSSMKLQGSEISGNFCSYGGGIFSRHSSSSIKNTTISSNNAYNGGGIYYTSSVSGTQMNIESSTISVNTVWGPSHFPGGIYANGSFTSVMPKLKSTIVSDNANIDLGVGPSNWPIKSLGHNIIGTLSFPAYAFLYQLSDLLNINPKLNSLADNGGPTRTHSIKCDSPALNAGGTSSSSLFDQRGHSRVAYGALDIGAYELNASDDQSDLLEDDKTLCANSNCLELKPQLPHGTYCGEFQWFHVQTKTTIINGVPVSTVKKKLVSDEPTYCFNMSKPGEYTICVEYQDCNGSEACFFTDCITLTVLPGNTPECKELKSIQPQEDKEIHALNIQAYPNPFDSEITIDIDIDKTGHYTIDLLNILGTTVMTLYSGNVSNKGVKQFKINGSELQSGQYFIRLISSDGTSIIKNIQRF